MNENLLEAPIERSIYKISTIRLATFFGGPVAGGYMIATNFKTFGDEKKKKMTWLFTLLTTAIIFSLSLLPVLVKVPGIVYAIAYFAFANFFATKYQQDAINLHLEQGGKEFSKGNIVLVSVLGFLVIVAVVVLMFLLQDLSVRR